MPAKVTELKEIHVTKTKEETPFNLADFYLNHNKCEQCGEVTRLKAVVVGSKGMTFNLCIHCRRALTMV